MNQKNFEKLYNELEEWMGSNDHDGSMEYAFNNGYELHAVCLWESTGASKYNFSANVNRKAEMEEITSLINSADIFVCPDCNHHGFYEKGELTEPPNCMSCCGDNMKLDEGAD